MCETNRNFVNGVLTRVVRVRSRVVLFVSAPSTGNQSPARTGKMFISKTISL